MLPLLQYRHLNINHYFFTDGQGEYDYTLPKVIVFTLMDGQVQTSEVQVLRINDDNIVETISEEIMYELGPLENVIEEAGVFFIQDNDRKHHLYNFFY